MAQGETVFAAKCQACHGEKGAGGPNDRLVGGAGTIAPDKAPVKTVGSYWPYATTLFDYVRRAMPWDRPKSLTDEEVYAVAAYVLYLNGVIKQDDVHGRPVAAAGEDAEPRGLHRLPALAAEVTRLGAASRTDPTQLVPALEPGPLQIPAVGTVPGQARDKMPSRMGRAAAQPDQAPENCLHPLLPGTAVRAAGTGAAMASGI